jgi:molecular chaperone GrpE
MTEGLDQQVNPAEQPASLDPKSESEAVTAGGQEPGPVQERDEVQSLQQELAAAREEAASNQDKFLRARADMENYKKRIERTYADLAKTSKKSLLNKLLGVKDNLERALHYGEASEGNGEGIIEGVRLTQYQLDQLLQQEGVRPIEAEGKPFDPRFEEAVHSVNDATVPDHTVVQVVRRGYTYGEDGEVLRPAQVVVSVHSAEGSPNDG